MSSEGASWGEILTINQVGFFQGPVSNMVGAAPLVKNSNVPTMMCSNE